MAEHRALDPLGWTDEWDRAFAIHRAAGLVPGRVSLEHNHVYRVLTETGELLAEAAGKLKHDADHRIDLPVVGDWVATRRDRAGGRSQIRAVLPRRAWLSRKVAGRESVEQVLAANIDTIFVVFGLERGVKRRAIERYLVASVRSGTRSVIVLNKRDLADDVAAAVAEARTVADGLPVLAVSTKTGAGFDALEAYLGAGSTLVLIGPSGVGKSSIVNCLVGEHVLPTGEVRPWDARGRHTSVHRQLVVRAAGGVIIDTPGIRELQLWDTNAVGNAFGDIVALAAECRFRDCQHDQEPGCAVKAAVAAQRLDAGRYESFLKLQREQAAIERNRQARQQDPSRRPGIRKQTPRSAKQRQGR